MATVQEVVNKARLDLNDDDKVRHSDIVLASFVSDYVQQAILLRPDQFFRTFLQLPSASLQLNDVFPMKDTYMRGCADYLIARAKMRGTEESNMAEASAYLSLSSKGSGV